MRKFLLPWLIVFVALLLTACTEDRIITINIDDGHTITQSVGEADIDVSSITVTDQDGMNLLPFLEFDGPYDLNEPGDYSLVLSVSDNFGASVTRDIRLIIENETCEDNPDQAQCIVDVTGIELEAESVNVTEVLVDGFIRLQWTITPTNASNTNITIATSDETIASVSSFGYVFGHQEGQVTVTLTTEDGGYSVSKVLSVREATCTEDPLQDKCIYAFLLDTSRITTIPTSSVDTTTYPEVYPNNRIYYEIFVRDFADSDDDNIGDFDGITDNIPYLETLGVGGIWLMPMMETTSEHGYDVSDYYEVNPEYGTMTDFEELIAALDDADIDIIIDLVVNHMGAHNDKFQDVLRNGTSSDYYDWFTWISEDDPQISETGSWGQTIWWKPANRYWLKAAPFSLHSSIEDKYFFGTFSDWMPDINLDNEDAVQYIYDVAEFWLNKGVHGFRMDATSHLYALHENDSVTDRNAKNIEFLTAFHDHVVAIDEDAFVVAEAWEGYDVYIPYHSSGNSIFNFQANYWIKDAVRGYLSSDIGSALSTLYDDMVDANPDYIDSIFISNHDMDRAAVQIDDDDELRMAAEILLTTKSNPFIYYGDEIGILGMRTNMVWGDYYDSMFVEYADRDIDTVSEQIANPDSLLQSYIELGEVRNDSLALSYGDFIPYTSDNVDGYYRLFEQGDDVELIVVLFNFSGSTTVPIPDEFTSYDILYHTYENNLGGISPKGTVILQLPEALIETLIY